MIDTNGHTTLVWSGRVSGWVAVGGGGHNACLLVRRSVSQQTIWTALFHVGSRGGKGGSPEKRSRAITHTRCERCLAQQWVFIQPTRRHKHQTNANGRDYRREHLIPRSQRVQPKSNAWYALFCFVRNISSKSSPFLFEATSNPI